ncbi:MAG: hypothetical protein RBR26_12490, partial [Methanosarcina mazei]|nr:hypothetical protein [Methanosarcina mazei]
MPGESLSEPSTRKNQESEYVGRLDFVYNNPLNETKVITTLSKNIENCDHFDFSVAFVSMSGVTALLKELRPFREGGKRSRILTTDYLNFN